MIELQHGRLKLSLHTLREGAGSPLLLLHGLRGSAGDWQAASLPWAGPIFALDFSGHGHSEWLRGGAYHPEYWACDADIALAAIGGGGKASLLGRGVGAYVALLLAGARAQEIDHAVLLDGPGLAGGGPMPNFDEPFAPADLPSGPRLLSLACDPAVQFSEFGVRPPQYACGFARAARRITLLDDGGARPPWWRAVRDLETVQIERGELARALRGG
jgi:pimeloyl-ACP methyl ester carboxylesterase